MTHRSHQTWMNGLKTFRSQFALLKESNFPSGETTKFWLTANLCHKLSTSAVELAKKLGCTVKRRNWHASNPTGFGNSKIWKWQLFFWGDGYKWKGVRWRANCSTRHLELNSLNTFEKPRTESWIRQHNDSPTIPDCFHKQACSKCVSLYRPHRDRSISTPPNPTCTHNPLLHQLNSR